MIDNSRENIQKNSSVVDVSSVNVKLTNMECTNEKGSEKRNDNVYEPYSHRDKKHTTSDFGALTHMFKASLGSGVLAIPKAFQKSGLIVGLIGTIMMGMICSHCYFILLKCSYTLCVREKRPTMSFPETAEVAFKTGPPRLRRYSLLAKRFVNLTLMAAYYLGNTVFVVLISETLKTVCEHYIDINLGIRWYILILGIPLIPLGLIKRLKYLVPVTAAGAFCLIFGVVVTLYHTLQDIPPISSRNSVSTLDELPSFFATVIFAMEGIGPVIPIENAMKNPTHFRGIVGVLSFTMTLVVTLYCTIGFFGYLKFGDHINSNITLNMPDDVLSQCVKLMVALSILSTYALQLFVPTELIWNRMKLNVSTKYHNSAFYGLKLSLVAGNVIIALLIPSLGTLFSLVGSVCLSTLGLWIPAMIEIVTFWEDMSYWRVMKNIFIMLCSALALATGSYTSIRDIIAFYMG